MLDDATVRTGFDEAVTAWQRIVGRPAVADAWDGASVLDEYSVGGLVTHVTMGLRWALVLLDTEVGAGDALLDPGDYFAALKVEPTVPLPPLHHGLVQQAEDRAAHGAEPTIARSGEAIATLRARLSEEDLRRGVDLRPAYPSAMRLADFLATRVVELTVHADDLAVSLGETGLDPGRTASEVAAHLLTATATAQHGAGATLRALTRRERADASVFPVL